MPSGWFSWKGELSSAHGLSVLKYPDMVIPCERATDTVVFGRSGSLTSKEGEDVRDSFVIGIECTIKDMSQFVGLSSWLHGSGELIIGNDSTHCYKARVSNQIALERIAQAYEYRKLKAQFVCQPYRYSLFWFSHTFMDALEPNGGTVTNPGTAAALPKITVTGYGKVYVTVGDVTVNLTLTEAGVTAHASIVLDCELQEAYTVGEGGALTNANGQMQGEFPTLPVGSTAISYGAQSGCDGGIGSVNVEARWREM